MDRNARRDAWERFERTGEVGAYLLYCAVARAEREADGPTGEQ